MRDTYISAKQHAAEAQAQFKKEAALGAMCETSLEQASAELGKLSLASWGALEKKDGSYRVIHDATHGLAVNSKIRVQDQRRNPPAGDVQVLSFSFLAVSGDVARAHRPVKIAKTGIGGTSVVGLAQKAAIW